MTTDQKQEALKMRMQGYTYQHIANSLGVSKQRIHKVISWIPGTYAKTNTGKKKNPDFCVYPVIFKFLEDNEESYSGLAKQLEVTNATLSRWLKGGEISLSNANKIARIVGKPIEKVFKRKN